MDAKARYDRALEISREAWDSLEKLYKMACPHCADDVPIDKHVFVPYDYAHVNGEACVAGKLRRLSMALDDIRDELLNPAFNPDKVPRLGKKCVMCFHAASGKKEGGQALKEFVMALLDADGHVVLSQRTILYPEDPRRQASPELVQQEILRSGKSIAAAYFQKAQEGAQGGGI